MTAATRRILKPFYAATGTGYVVARVTVPVVLVLLIAGCMGPAKPQSTPGTSEADGAACVQQSGALRPDVPDSSSDATHIAASAITRAYDVR